MVTRVQWLQLAASAAAMSALMLMMVVSVMVRRMVFPFMCWG